VLIVATISSISIKGRGAVPKLNTVSKRTAAAALTPLQTYEDTATHSNSRDPYIQYLTGDREQAVRIQLQAERILAAARLQKSKQTGSTPTKQLHSEELIPTFPFCLGRHPFP
jgi:hypothetical protein